MEGACYTILGSKPITEIILDSRSKEIKQKEYLEALTLLSKKEKHAVENQPTAHWDPKYDFEETWYEWEANLNKNRIRKCLIVHFPRKLAGLDFVYIVNIISTATLLQEHYHLFKDYVGFDFSPLETTLEISNPDSIFWNLIINGKTTTKKVCLLGLLFGYGIENSVPFSWLFLNEEGGEVAQFVSFLKDRLIQECMPMGFKKLSSDDFPLPGFKAFSQNSPTLSKYRKEREQIKKIYSKGSLNDVTISELYSE